MLLRTRKDLHVNGPNEFRFPRLAADKLYVCLNICDGYFCVVNESGEPMFVPMSKFEIVEKSIPTDWIQETRDDAVYASPIELDGDVLDRWHDRELGARRVFADLYIKLWRHYEKELAGQAMVIKLS
jgi:hypothetical protein